MDKFDKLLKNFDLEFFGKARHKISIEKALELTLGNKALIIDVRTEEELDYVCFDFMRNIPVSKISERLADIPRDKIVIVFCSSVIRAPIVYAYLRVNGYKDVKILTAGLSEMAGYLKPGYVLSTTEKN